MQEREEWRPVPGWEDRYEVSSAGRVRSVRKGMIMRTHPAKSGHMQLVLSGPRRRTVTVHRLMLEAFVGPCPEGMEACHNDGDPSNNTLPNLRWDTRRNNMRDKVAHGTMCRGERIHTARLTEDDVRVIRDLLRDGRNRTEIAREYGVTKYAIRDIDLGVSWRHVC